MAEKKYYWLKLKKNFFKRHDIEIIESMPNGKDYVLFYLKMLLESIDHEGRLRFNEMIPYNEDMLSVVTRTNVDIVRRAMEIFLDLGMVEIKDDKTIYMAEVKKMIGSAADNDNAIRQQRFRDKKKEELKALEAGGVTKSNENALRNVTGAVTKSNENALRNVTGAVTKSNESKSIEKDIENRERVVDVEVEERYGNGSDDPFDKLSSYSLEGKVFLTENQIGELIDIMGLDVFDQYVEKLENFIIEKDARVANHYATILKWYREDCKV